MWDYAKSSPYHLYAYALPSPPFQGALHSELQLTSNCAIYRHVSLHTLGFLRPEIIVIAKVCDCGGIVMTICGIDGHITIAVSQLFVSGFFKLDVLTFNNACLLHFIFFIFVQLFAFKHLTIINSIKLCICSPPLSRLPHSS